MANAELTIKADLAPESMALLREIRDRLPAATPTATPKGSDLAEVKRLVLATMLDTLDGWINGARENHDAGDHSHENRGDECWRQFAPDDIRRMVNDVAREVGISEFPAPLKPREDM